MVSEKAKNGSPELELTVLKVLILLFFAYLLMPVFGINLIKIFPEKRHYDFRPVYSYKYFQAGLAQAKTEGNWTFIPVNVEGQPGDFPDYVISLIREFEETRKVKVTNRWFDVSDHPFSPPFFSRIWLNHEPRKK